MSFLSRDKLHLAARFAALGVSLLTLVLIYRRLDITAMRKVLLSMDVAWFAAASLAFLSALTLAAARWHLLLRMKGLATHPTGTWRTAFIGHFFNVLLFGPSGGDIAKATLYSRWYGTPVSSVLSTCALDRLAGGIGFILFITSALILASIQGDLSATLQMLLQPKRLLVLAGILTVLLLAAWVIRRKSRQKSPLRAVVEHFWDGLQQLKKDRKLAGRMVFFAFLSQICLNCVLACCLLAVSKKEFSLAEIFWTFPVISWITSVPVTFSGAGVREGAALVLLGLYGIPATDAVGAALLVLVTYMSWASVAGLYFWKERLTVHNRSILLEPSGISVVIPALNEELAIGETIRRAQAVPEVNEIIVVDGGSRDETPQIAERMGCKVITSAPSRGRQLRIGAAAASGDIVLMLHADTWVPPNAGRAIIDTLRDGMVVGGGCWKRFRNPTWLMIGSRLRCGVRLLFFGRVLGDQAIFVRRAVLEEIGGVPDVPLMEEFELCRKLRAAGRLALAGATVTTSERRFLKHGVLKTYALMWRVTLRYHLGTPPAELRRIYEKE